MPQIARTCSLKSMLNSDFLDWKVRIDLSLEVDRCALKNALADQRYNRFNGPKVCKWLLSQKILTNSKVMFGIEYSPVLYITPAYRNAVDVNKQLLIIQRLRTSAENSISPDEVHIVKEPFGDMKTLRLWWD